MPRYFFGRLGDVPDGVAGVVRVGQKMSYEAGDFVSKVLYGAGLAVAGEDADDGVFDQRLPADEFAPWFVWAEASGIVRDDPCDPAYEEGDIEPRPPAQGVLAMGQGFARLCAFLEK